ncbi:hypothetical protein GWC77_10610 [Paraburkholderia sp. NMBU_R16]|uniref:hypothetical protein n=1 Tax=Paraburkholderia sp. NMBU_R16 TaxID=2698676 RepID=UPI001564780F|nr:hypothetical protein [Paraburkholderia sp. NMBU_R16]NRO96383.1 hypothetical protein [Paraburkholderia sp. NMBU_R16]
MSPLQRTRIWPSGLLRTLGHPIEVPRPSELGEWCRTLVSMPERWGGAHRLLMAVAVASVAFALAAQGGRALRHDRSVAAASAALAALAHRLDDARSKAAALPELRRAVQGLPAPAVPSDEMRSTAWQSIAALATRSGMTLQSVEPGDRPPGGLEAGHVIRFAATSSFASFIAFLSALSTLPVLVVPAELKLEHGAQGLLLQASLEVHDSLPSVPARRAGEIGGPSGDPFGAPPAAVPSPASELRLTGLMIEGARSLALIEADGQGAVYVPGQMLGNERLMRIGAASITLAHRSGTRVLAIGAGS